eukprot:c1164_g1_i1.p1 GENE.c1164_g1_i1~~c1164_g1_i1.p1  ORF type:complete len:150 (+),score=27.07 c1164_g1_i1:38-451(+)
MDDKDEVVIRQKGGHHGGEVSGGTFAERWMYNRRIIIVLLLLVIAIDWGIALKKCESPSDAILVVCTVGLAITGSAAMFIQTFTTFIFVTLWFLVALLLSLCCHFIFAVSIVLGLLAHLPLLRGVPTESRSLVSAPL